MTTILPTDLPPVRTATAPARRSAFRRLLRGRNGDPAWTRPALLALLAATGLLYLWDLSASGWANAYYSAAVQAGAENWTAFFYGSSDAGNAITVDKPPAALWVMALSVRLFGLSSWAILAPQALMGVATVGVLYLAVLRVAGPGAGLLAGTAMALTPVAALMFRFNVRVPAICAGQRVAARSDGTVMALHASSTARRVRSSLSGIRWP